jgi:hypothetical protein
MAEVFAIIGAVKWITDQLGNSKETENLIQKLKKLETKYAGMDKRTNDSQKVRDKLMQAKGMITAKQGGQASSAIDGCLALVGLA